MKRFKSSGQLQRFVSTHDPVANLFHLPRQEMLSTNFCEKRSFAYLAGKRPLADAMLDKFVLKDLLGALREVDG